MNYFHSSASGGRRRPARIVWFLAALMGLLPPGRLVKGADTVYVIPHTHWEGAVFKTREEYLEMGLPNIVKALYLLKKYPEYRFVLDQMCYVRPFVERYPAEVPAMREFLSQGRLQIARRLPSVIRIFGQTAPQHPIERGRRDFGHGRRFTFHNCGNHARRVCSIE